MRLPALAPVALAVLVLAAAAPARAQGGDPSTPVPGQAAAAVAATATPAHAGVSGVDVMTSTVFQERQSSFSGLALRLRLKSGALVPAVEILPAVEYWRNDNRVSVRNLETSRSDATMGCQVRWTFAREHWQPYVGGGIAVHFLDERVSSSDLGIDDHNSTVRGGYSLHGGVNFTITDRISNFVELTHHGVSRFRQLKFNTGLSWNFH